MDSISANIQICMEVGVGKIKSLSMLHKYTLKRNLSTEFSAFHAFTGCEFNSALFGKDKKNSFQ